MEVLPRIYFSITGYIWKMNRKTFSALHPGNGDKDSK
jgi:hypothetical protein